MALHMQNGFSTNTGLLSCVLDGKHRGPCLFFFFFGIASGTPGVARSGINNTTPLGEGMDGSLR